jgi:hypothetical protein
MLSIGRAAGHVAQIAGLSVWSHGRLLRKASAGPVRAGRRRPATMNACIRRIRACAARVVARREESAALPWGELQPPRRTPGGREPRVRRPGGVCECDEGESLSRAADPLFRSACGRGQRKRASRWDSKAWRVSAKRAASPSTVASMRPRKACVNSTFVYAVGAPASPAHTIMLVCRDFAAKRTPRRGACGPIEAQLRAHFVPLLQKRAVPSRPRHLLRRSAPTLRGTFLSGVQVAARPKGAQCRQSLD